jgi:threonine/homoserine efflux transporter RhtA
VRKRALYGCARRPHRPSSATSTANQGNAMNTQLSLAPIIALLAGILILVQPRLLNYIVAIYLIVIGLLGLFGASGMRLT